MADMAEDSHIYDEITDDIYVPEPLYDKIKDEVAKIVQDKGTVPKDLKKEKIKMVILSQVLSKDNMLTLSFQGVAYNNLKRMRDKTGENATLIHIHFKELGLTKFSRDEIYTATDLIG